MMYLRELRIALGLALLLVLPISAAEGEMTPVLTDTGFVYWYKVVSDTAWSGRDMPSVTLAAYAYQAYQEMQQLRSSSRQDGIPSHRLPPRVSAMSVPADSLVFIASSAVRIGSSGMFAYHPANVPPQVTELLRNPLISGGWATDTHRVGGSCSEVVCLSVYFQWFPYRSGLPPPLGAKIVTVGESHSGAGLGITVQKPCENTANGGGCMSFLVNMGMRWCGPGSTTDPMYRRDEITSTSPSQFDCHGANAPPQFTDKQSLPEIATNTTGWIETVTAIPSIVTNDAAGASLSTPLSASPFGTDEVVTSSMHFDAATFSTQVSSGGVSTATTPVNAANIVGDEGKEASNCVPECVAGFNGCSSEPTRSSVQVMSCQTLAKCYLIQPPYQSALANPGVNSNPEDPNAQTGPAAKPKIDMGKARNACNDVSVLTSPLFSTRQCWRSKYLE